MPEELFDLGEQYEEMLRRGVSLSGEDPSYFMRGRIDDLAKRLPAGWKPGRILDFGCGTGESAAYFAAKFPGAQVVGADTSANALAVAQQRHGSAQVTFVPLEQLPQSGHFQLCYVNGVFHHIEPYRRSAALGKIFHALSRGSYFALFENNPWNPGTRLVMSRIPFDRAAQTFNYLVAEKLVTAAGFRLAGPARFLFYFPRALAGLRFAERALRRIPFGAQYYILSAKD